MCNNTGENTNQFTTMRSKSIEKSVLCLTLMLSMSSAAFLYSRSDVSPSLNSITDNNVSEFVENKSLPDLRILDFIWDKASTIISASYATNCIH